MCIFNFSKLEHIDEQFLQFCHTGPILPCIDICVYLCILCVFVSYCIGVVLL